MGVITDEQLQDVIKEQEKLKADALLGRLLVARGYCSDKEFNVAMKAQRSMRGNDKFKQAMTIADISLQRHRRPSLIEARHRIQEKSALALRHLTGPEHPIVAAVALKAGK